MVKLATFTAIQQIYGYLYLAISLEKHYLNNLSNLLLNVPEHHIAESIRYFNLLKKYFLGTQ